MAASIRCTCAHEPCVLRNGRHRHPLPSCDVASRAQRAPQAGRPRRLGILSLVSVAPLATDGLGTLASGAAASIVASLRTHRQERAERRCQTPTGPRLLPRGETADSVGRSVVSVGSGGVVYPWAERLQAVLCAAAEV